MAPTCTALSFSDQTPCKHEAVSLNGLFCGFHSRQCQGLYAGYKKRNARLDALTQSPPSYLKKSSIALVNQTFEDVDSGKTLDEIHEHLSKRYTLLSRVIAARKLHHSHFFAENYDYGHQHFLDNLQNQKHIVNHALEQLERRKAAVLYEKENWFQWIRERQNQEEAQRESEKKKIKREAALWKRHWKQFQLRMKALSEKEDRKRQDEYLDQVYNERMSSEEEDMWDPVEDFVEDERGSYVDMIKMFLMRELESDANGRDSDSMDLDPISSEPSIKTDSKSTGKKGRKKPQKDQTAKPQASEKSDLALPETKSQMRQRLREGVKVNHAKGRHILGTMENPEELRYKTAGLPEDEIDKLLGEVAEVKQLLLCRILLSHAALLPAAARANSVDEFLNDRDVDSAHLRDLCLELENPGLQDVRDACADLVRGDDEDRHAPMELDSQGGRQKTAAKNKTDGWVAMWQPKDEKPLDQWMPKRELEQRQRRYRQNQVMNQQGDPDDEVQQLNFDIDDHSMVKNERMRVKVCGRYIYNYPSENRMTRGGWLQFCVIAKDSDLFDAIKLCRNWEEFYELNTLAVWKYFPAANWRLWVGDQLNLQLLQMGFIPYDSMSKAHEMTVHHQTGSRGLERRAHASLQSRNYIAAHVKRDDQASRRFIRYLSMQTHRVMLLVRDGKTGRILVSPPKDHLWLVREKSGFGRATKKSWNVLREVGWEFFDELETNRKWSFGFNDYYDVVVWDNEPGEQYSNVYNVVCEMLYKAHRLHDLRDTHGHAKPILSTLTRERETMRVRDIKPGEEVQSLYDEITDPRTRHVFFDTNQPNNEALREIEPPARLFYDEVDEAEDRVLFPEENLEDDAEIVVGDELKAMAKLEYQGPDMRRFALDLDTDEELPETKLGDDSDKDSCVDKHTCVHSGDESDGSVTASEAERLVELLKRRTKEETDYLKHCSKFQEPSDDPNYDLPSQHRRFMTREMAKVVKEGWHNADLEPEAQPRYRAAQNLIKKMRDFNYEKWPLTQLSPLTFLDINPHEHRKIIPDMERAFSMMSLFFASAEDFFSSEPGSDCKDHLLIDQVERAKHLPVRRYKHSNKNMPKQFWKEWDDIKSRGGSLQDVFPAEWNAAIRPIIAHLYKEEILLNSYVPHTCAQAIASREPTGKLDLYIDNRNMIPKPNAGSIMPPEKETLLSAARRFAGLNPGARFAFLRVWSAPHFYPLVLGPDRARREEFSFMDGMGRCWMWKFVPKDMGFSEMSIHMAVHYRIQRYKSRFGSKLVHRSDTLLVMGEDEKELLKLASAATYAVQDDPWRLEIDLWKSFVNIDIKTLDGLDVGWLD